VVSSAPVLPPLPVPGFAPDKNRSFFFFKSPPPLSQALDKWHPPRQSLCYPPPRLFFSSSVFFLGYEAVDNPLFFFFFFSLPGLLPPLWIDARRGFSEGCLQLCGEILYTWADDPPLRSIPSPLVLLRSCGRNLIASLHSYCSAFLFYRNPFPFLLRRLIDRPPFFSDVLLLPPSVGIR